MNTQKKVWQVIVPVLSCFVIAVLSFRIVTLHMMIEGSDYLLHAIKALDIFQHGVQGFFERYSSPIWHLGVKFFERIVHMNLFDSAASMTMLIYVCIYIGIFYFIKVYLGKYYSNNLCGLFALVLMIIQPISWSGLTFVAEPGRNVFNTWHNPTSIGAKLFGIIAFFYFHKLFEEDEEKGKVAIKNYIIFAIVMCLANLCKPSFSQVFLPTIVLYCVVYCLKSKFAKFGFCFSIALSVIPSMLLFLFQAMVSFDEEGQGIEIAWFDVMGHSGKAHPLAILGTIAFPLYVTVVYFKKNFKDRKISTAWLMYGVGFLEYAALAEKGVRRYHGNFSWGYFVSIFILHVVCAIKFFRVMKEEESWKAIAGVILWLLHLLCGYTYLKLQLSGIGIWY